MRSIGLLGGSFNPIHIGHLRLAMEIIEIMRPHRLDLIPCAEAPHKSAKGMLPFALRCELAQCAVNSMEQAWKQKKAIHHTSHTPYLTVNSLEGQRSGPSYTWDTLQHYTKYETDARPFFVLGGEDFTALPQWFRGLEIPEIADIIVVPRDGANSESFEHSMRTHWPQAVAAPHAYLQDTLGPITLPPSSLIYAMQSGHHCIYLPVPRLEISATLLRKKWLSNHDLSFLLPFPVINILEARRAEIEALWRSMEKA